MNLTPDDLQRARDIGLFGGLGDDVLQAFVGALEVRELTPGTVVFREGECGRELYVLFEGEIEVLRRSEQGHETRMAILGSPATWFGEMSVLDILPRPPPPAPSPPCRFLLRLTAHELDGALPARHQVVRPPRAQRRARGSPRRLRVSPTGSWPTW